MFYNLTDEKSLINAKLSVIKFFDSCDNDLDLNRHVLEVRNDLINMKKEHHSDIEMVKRIDSLHNFIKSFSCLANA